MDVYTNGAYEGLHMYRANMLECLPNLWLFLWKGDNHKTNKQTKNSEVEKYLEDIHFGCYIMNLVFVLQNTTKNIYINNKQHIECIYIYIYL